MSNETQYLQKIQAAYDSQNADANRTLRSAFFEYEHVLARFTALKHEVDRALLASADLDLSVIVERIRSALAAASQLAVDFDTLDDTLLVQPAVSGFIAAAEARLTLASADTYREKFVAVKADATASAVPPAPLDPVALAFAEGEDLLFGDNGKTQDFVQAAVIFHRLADQKHPRALMWLARLYGVGKGVKQSYATQLDLMRQAAELGEGQAMADLSDWYLTGCESASLPQSFDKALFWAKRAQNAGNRQAQYALGRVHADEKYSNHNPILALEHFQEGARIGCSVAAAQLGNVYRWGIGVPQDIAKAAAAYELSFSQGNRQWIARHNTYGAQRLVEIYELGDGVPADAQLALAWFHRLDAESKGEVAYLIACRYRDEANRKSFDKVFAWATEGAQNGSPACMGLLGQLYLESGPKQNFVWAEHWLIKSWDTSPTNSWVAHSLATLYDKQGPRFDIEKYLIWMERTAEVHHDDYYFYLTSLSFYDRKSDNTTHDIYQAIALLERGLTKGRGGWCAEQLAKIYTSHESCIDYFKAAGMYRIAIEQGRACEFQLSWIYFNKMSNLAGAITTFKEGSKKKNWRKFF